MKHGRLILNSYNKLFQKLENKMNVGDVSVGGRIISKLICM